MPRPEDNRASDDATSFESFLQRCRPIVELEGETIHCPEWARRLGISDTDEYLAYLAKVFGWSHERLPLLTKFVDEYRHERSIENYLRVRREFREVDIRVEYFSGTDPLSALEEEFERRGVDPHLIAAALKGNDPSIDELCLHLMELLVARDKLPKEGPGHIERRRNAISDAMVNYLIAMILEAGDMDGSWPPSLDLLIRHQLCGSNPDLHETYLLKQKRENLVNAYDQLLAAGEEPSVRRLASMAGVPRSTAHRWLKETARAAED
jgi:hypothetical protein